MGKRKVALYKQVCIRNLFKNPVPDKIRSAGIKKELNPRSTRQIKKTGNGEYNGFKFKSKLEHIITSSLMEKMKRLQLHIKEYEMYSLRTHQQTNDRTNALSEIKIDEGMYPIEKLEAG